MKPNRWEFIANDDGTFKIVHLGAILRTSIPDSWLEGEASHYGLCGEEYREIPRQLGESGQAIIDL
jgi:hypothetical protein